MSALTFSRKKNIFSNYMNRHTRQEVTEAQKVINMFDSSDHDHNNKNNAWGAAAVFMALSTLAGLNAFSDPAPRIRTQTAVLVAERDHAIAQRKPGDRELKPLSSEEAFNTATRQVTNGQDASKVALGLFVFGGLVSCATAIYLGHRSQARENQAEAENEAYWQRRQVVPVPQEPGQ